MAENDDTTTVAGAEPPPESSPETKPTGENAAGGVPENRGQGLARKIGDKVSRLAEKWGLNHKRKGRPRKCRACDGQGCIECGGTGSLPNALDLAENPELPEKPAQVVSEKSDLPAAPAADTSAVPPGRSLFHRSVVSGALGLIRFLDDYCRSLARRAKMPADWVKEIFDRAKPEPQVLDDFAESLAAVLAKHNVDVKNSEEISLAINGAKIVAPYGTVIMEIRSYIKRMENGGAK